MFKVGQKVVCVDDSPSWLGEASLVKRGDIYTISSIIFDGSGVVLAEVDPSPNRGWHSARFRPVVERKTDISVFQAMLKQAPATADLTLAHTSAGRGGAA